MFFILSRCQYTDPYHGPDWAHLPPCAQCALKGTNACSAYGQNLEHIMNCGNSSYICVCERLDEANNLLSGLVRNYCKGEDYVNATVSVLDNFCTQNIFSTTVCNP